MAASQPGASSSTQKADNRILLFRLQMLLIDGGLTSLRNYVDQNLAAQSTTLSACLANEKSIITLLKGRQIITQVQYDLLYPSSGIVSTSDLDITLIICLMRSLKCFKLNSKFNWNIPPVQNDTSIEADICRLKLFRNEICHISTTTGIQHNDFINKWKEIEQILLRIDKVYPVKDFQQTITDFQSSILDPKTEKRVTGEIEKWNKFDKAVLKQTLEAFSRKRAEKRKRDSDNIVKIAKTEKQLLTVDNYQQQKLDWGNAPKAKKRKTDDLYQDKKKGTLVAIERKKTLQNDGNVVVNSKWTLGSIDEDDPKLDVFDRVFITLLKGRKECSLDEHEYEELLEKFRELVSSISDKCLDSILQTEVAGETQEEAETSFSETMNDQKKQRALVIEREKTFQNDGNVVVTAKWKLESIDDDDRKLDVLDRMFISLFKGRKECSLDEHEYEQLLEKFRELVSSISDKCFDSILQTEVAGETEEEAETSFSETMNDQRKQMLVETKHQN